MTYDPTTRSATGYWRGPYSSDPWAAVATAGVSATTGALSHAGASPSAGTGLNGIASAMFNGTSQDLLNATAMSTLFSASAGQIFGLFKRITTTAISGSVDGDPQIWADSGGAMGLALTSSGLSAWVYDGALKSTTPDASSSGGFDVFRMRWNGTTVGLTINNGSETTALAGNAAILANTLVVASNYSGAGRANIELLELQLSIVEGGSDYLGFGQYCQDTYLISRGFPPAYTPMNLTSYVDRIDRRQMERLRFAAARQLAYVRPFAPPVGTIPLLNAGITNVPNNIDRRQINVGMNTARMLSQTALSPLPIPTDTTAFAQMRAVYPNEVRGRLFRTVNQDHIEVPPYQPPVGAITPVALTEFPDSIMRPRFGAHLQLHVSSMQPQPERTSVFFDAKYPDAVRRPRLLPASMLSSVRSALPEQTVALGFQGWFPQATRRSSFDARHHQSVAYWPYPIPDAPVVAVPIIRADGVITLLSSRTGTVVGRVTSEGSVTLLTAKGSRVVVLDSQSGEVSLLSIRSSKVE